MIIPDVGWNALSPKASTGPTSPRPGFADVKVTETSRLDEHAAPPISTVVPVPKPSTLHIEVRSAGLLEETDEFHAWDKAWAAYRILTGR